MVYCALRALYTNAPIQGIISRRCDARACAQKQSRADPLDCSSAGSDIKSARSAKFLLCVFVSLCLRVLCVKFFDADRKDQAFGSRDLWHGFALSRE